MESIKIESLTEKEKQELIRNERNKYQKEWHEKQRSQGKDKTKEYQDRYWLRKAGIQV